jgi:hypothetical protein
MLATAPLMAVVVDERQVVRREPPPHGEIGEYRLSHQRCRAAVAQVGIRQLGKQPLALIISYPVVRN